MEHVLIERDFDEPVAYDGFRGASERDPGCLERYRVSYCGSFVALDDRFMLCHALAPDAESVRAPARLNTVPYSRLWTADMLRGPGFTAETTPRALAKHDDGGFDARPYQRVTIVRGRIPTSTTIAEVLAIAKALLPDECRHLFSYAQRGGELFASVFDRAVERPIERDGLRLAPAVVRTRKRPLEAIGHGRGPGDRRVAGGG